MSEQLDLVDVVIVPATPSAWDWIRNRHKATHFIRDINLDTGKQEFVPVRAGHILEDATVIRPGKNRSPEEFEAIVAEYDRLWHEAHTACPPSNP